jgi:hypothetical protein
VVTARFDAESLKENSQAGGGGCDRVSPRSGRLRLAQHFRARVKTNLRRNESLNLTAKVAKFWAKVAEQGLLCVPLRIALASFALKFMQP